MVELVDPRVLAIAVTGQGILVRSAQKIDELTVFGRLGPVLKDLARIQVPSA